MLRSLIIGLLVSGITSANAQESPETGNDLRAVFARAAQGAPLTYVVFGGSIAQNGEGWIGTWLRETFPKSCVTVVNCGLSATGSDLGIFRVGRDVVAHKPDLVAIEFCVNDAAHPDADVFRCIESIVVRLKKLPNPPAILILEAATRNGGNLWRHQKIARHYGLVEINFQKVVDAHLKETNKAWEDYFLDKVHPNQAGNDLYARTMKSALSRFLPDEKIPTPKEICATAFLPPSLSSKPLLLDGRMVSLTNLTGVEGWTLENSLPKWWSRIFLGLFCSDVPGAMFTVPWRGTTTGVMYAMDRSYGSFFAEVKGCPPRHVFTNSRGGFSYEILAQDLPGQIHWFAVTLPLKTETPINGLQVNGPVKLGYLLLAGESDASPNPSAAASPREDPMDRTDR